MLPQSSLINEPFWNDPVNHIVWRKKYCLWILEHSFLSSLSLTPLFHLIQIPKNTHNTYINLQYNSNSFFFPFSQSCLIIVREHCIYLHVDITAKWLYLLPNAITLRTISLSPHGYISDFFPEYYQLQLPVQPLSWQCALNLQIYALIGSL